MKEKQIFTNMAIVQEIYSELVAKSEWYKKYRGDDSHVKAYDNRDLRPLSYFVIDFNGVPEDQKEEHYKKELDKLISAFDTLDPNTNRPYPEAVKPYIEKMYRGITQTLDPDIDWNDKEQVNRFIHVYLVSQSVETVFLKFSQEFIELFPTAEERRKIDAAIAKNGALFNRTDQILQKNGINLQKVNELSLVSYESTNFIRFTEYLTRLSSNQLLNDSDDFLIDPEVDPVFTDYFLGREVDTMEYDAVDGEDVPYQTADAERNIGMAIEMVLKNTMLEKRVAGAFNKTYTDYILINGKTLKEIFDEKKYPEADRDGMVARHLRDAMTDGKSRVEIARFGYENDGTINIKYQQLKLDLDKLNQLSGENGKKYPSNEQRDNELNSEAARIRQESDHVEYERRLLKTLDKSIPLARGSGEIRTLLPDFKPNDNIKSLETLDKKISELYDEHKAAEEDAKTFDGPIEKHFKNIKVEATLDTMSHLYCNIMSKIPAEKREDVYAFMKSAFIERHSNSVFQMLEKTFKQDAYNVNKSQEVLDHVLFYKCSQVLHNSGLYEKFINAAAAVIPAKDLEDILTDIDTYLPNQTNNNRVRYFKEDIDRIKAENEKNIADQQKLAELNEELDKVEGTVITSTVEYSVAQGDSVEKIYEAKRGERLDILHNSMLEQNEYKHYGDYFRNATATNKFFGVRAVRPKHYGNVNMAKEFCKDEVKFVIPEKVQRGLEKVINLMKEKGMLGYNVNSGESDMKAYGFVQIFDATERIREAIESNDAERIREARENYEQALSNMREVYKTIKEELAPTYDNLVGNISSFRETWVPNEFKDDLLLNSLTNGIFNLAMSLENNGVTLQSLFDNTNETVFELMKGYASKATPHDRLSQHESFSESLFDAVKGDEKDSPYPRVGVGRNLELLSQLSYGYDEYEKNAFSAMLMQSYDGYVLSLSQSSKQASVRGYMWKNPHETVANMFIVEPEDRDYNKLRAFEAVTVDGTEKIPPFNTMEYLESHKTLPSNIMERINTTVAELSVRGDGDPKKAVSAEHMSTIIRGAQIAAYEFMLSNPSPDYGDIGEEASAYEALKKMINDPQKAFSAVMSDELIEEMQELPPMNKYIKRFEKDGLNKLKSARKEARKEEKAYNKRVDKLQKKIDSLNKKLQKGGDAEKLNADIDKARAEIELLRGTEIARLESAYAGGKLPRDYFEQRKEDVRSGKHNNRAPIGVSERQSFKKFKAEFEKMHADEMRSSEITSEDVEFFYNRMIESARHDENRFMLTAMGKQPAPTLKLDDSMFKDEPIAQDMPEEQREQIIIEDISNENDIPKESKVFVHDVPQKDVLNK